MSDCQHCPRDAAFGVRLRFEDGTTDTAELCLQCREALGNAISEARDEPFRIAKVTWVVPSKVTSYGTAKL